MSERQLKLLIKKRAVIKGKLTCFGSYIKSITNSDVNELQNQIELQLRLHKFESLYDEFDGLQNELEELSEKHEEECKEREAFEKQYYSFVSAGRALIESHHKQTLPSNESMVAVGPNAPGHSHKRKVVELPKIDLPYFTGDYQHWLGYRDTFNSLIHSDDSIDSINKFHYLRASLKGNAALTISGLDFCADNYPVAWKILCERFDNKRLLENHHLSSLFQISSLQKESSVGLRALVDTTNKNIRALASLGQPVQHWDTLIIYIISAKLDSVTNREWEFHRNNLKDSPTLDIFTKFITNKADLLETLGASSSKHEKPDNNISKPKSFIVSSDKSKIKLCPLCGKTHLLHICDTFRALPVEARIQKAKALKVCTNCLRLGHSDYTCRLSHCKYCNKKHNTLLHTEQSQVTQIENVTLSAKTTNENPSKSSNILLSTAWVKVLDIYGHPHAARILLDNGSTANFITQDFCGKLKLNTSSVNFKVLGINNQPICSSRSCSLTLASNSSDYKINIDCIVIPQITTRLPSKYVNIQDLQLPSGICLADPSFHVPATIDILVGANIFWSVIGTNRIELGKQKPILFETQLGWLVSGDIQNNNNLDTEDKHTCMLTQTADFDLSRFWELDSISPRHHFSAEERACEEHFVKTTERKPDGRFIVSLPLKESPKVLGDSYLIAKRRFLSLERRLDRDPQMKQLYVDFMREYLELGHMTEINSHSRNEIACYLPHHGVMRESSSTTKLRVVFDASAATSSGKSLNDVLMVGATIQDDLLSILLRFRQHPYVVTADVEKMFRQTEIFERQRKLQQIVWRFDPSHTLKCYQLNTITYGTASAPYLATRCLTQLGHESKDPDIKRAICHDFYVDDFLSGHKTIEETVSLCQGVSKTLNTAKLNLRKWYSNNQTILMAVSGESSVSGFVDLSRENLSKTLGLNWKCSTDTLLFSINLSSNNVVNKRHILSTIAQVFDPLGLVTPCIVEAKILMQQLWLIKCDWDEPVPDHIQRAWSDFAKSLPSLNNLTIPRCVACHSSADVQMHIFTDASEKAYGACVHIRCSVNDGTVSVNLLASKSKIAPLKPTTIPRLELCAALLGTRLGIKILNSLTLQFTKCVLWSDSTIVLGWLNSSPSQLKPFVRHRVSEIQEGFAEHEVRYVPSKENPADLASRGLSADALGKSCLWWSGPAFLKLNESNWPNQSKHETYASDLPEMVKCFLVAQEGNIISHLISRCSVFSKLQRIVAFILRFINNCHERSKKTIGNITINEINIATNALLKAAQKDSFPEERSLLMAKKGLSNKNRLTSLSPFIDENELIRVGGRLNNTNYDYNMKHPVLLSSKHPLCILIFKMLHLKYLHCGPQLLLATARHNYWPLGGRNLAKRTVHSCVKCCRLKGKTLQPVMGNLPEQRAQLEFPFLETGVDYAGPVLIANHKGRGCKHIKSYICVFVCFATKAIHLELVSDLTKEAFVAALNRFTSRRGKPRTIHSDNGTTFVGAFNELSKLLRQISPADMNESGINFSFIPAYTPHFSGLCESAVKSVKHHLKRVLGLTYLDYEEMNTLLIQIEAILNSRPITPLSDDPSDLCPLTPAHFLIGRFLTLVPHPEITSSRISSLARFNRIELLKQHFWRRFSNEYVTLLQHKTKWKHSRGLLQEGTLVVIKDKSCPPLMWLLGRVVRVLPGSDGVARVADIRTRKGVIRRAFNTICPLPATSLEDASTPGVWSSHERE